MIEVITPTPSQVVVVQPFTQLVEVATGVPGPPGAPGSAGGITYTQASPASVWPITHNFGRLPNVTVYGLDGAVIGVDITSTSTTTNISFAFPVAGSARLI